VDIGFPGRHCIPGPLERAAACVESAHDTGWHALAEAGGDKSADDYRVAQYRRRAGDAVLLGTVQRQARVEIDGAARTEIRTDRTTRGIQGNQPGIEGSSKYPLAAWSGRSLAHPQRDAAAHRHVLLAHVDVRIEDPALLTIRGIEREHPVVGRAIVKRVVGHDRSDTEDS